MLKRRGDADLLEKPLRADGCRELLTQHLDRDPAAMPQVPREVHSGHAAASDLALDLIALRKCGRESPGERWRRGYAGQHLGGWSIEEVTDTIMHGEQ
jgi:hypothetical protein